MYKITKSILFFGLLIILTNSCNKQTAEDLPIANPISLKTNKIASEWVNLSLFLTKNTSGFTPPVAARAYGYVTLSMYEAGVHGSDKFASLVGQLNDLNALPIPIENTEYAWDESINAAAAEMCRNMYENTSIANLSKIDSLEAVLQNELTLNDEISNLSKNYGKQVALALFEWSKSDGGDECYKNNFPDTYVPPSNLGNWQPTPPAFSKAMQPYWGSCRPMSGKPNNICSVNPPLNYSEQIGSEFYLSAYEVYSVIKSITPERTQIANFWADGPGTTFTPAGHSLAIAKQLIAENNENLEDAVYIYAKTGLAVSNAFITCWKLKYTYNVLRPITYIRQVIDPTWTPIIATPPFPEYVSGHSTQSAAAAAVLEDYYGLNYAFTDHTKDTYGMAARSFTSINAAAEEASISRLYGGIHYRYGLKNGLELGKCIGKDVNNLKFKK